MRRFLPCSWIHVRARLYPRTSSSSRSHSNGFPKTMVAMRDLSTSTPSIRLDDMALSIRACSRSALRRCGDCRVYNSCFPRASPRSDRYQEVAAGTDSNFREKSRKVIMAFPFRRATDPPTPSSALSWRSLRASSNRGSHLPAHIPSPRVKTDSYMFF